MKVYLLTVEQVCDYDQELTTKTFYTRDDACAMLKGWRDKLIEEIHGLTWIIETDEADNFEAYELVRAAANRVSACVSECEVMGSKPPFFKRYAALKQEEIDSLLVALVKVGGSYRFYGDTFIKVLAGLGGFSEDYQFCVVRSAELGDDGRITIEVEADYQTYSIDASDVMGGFIHYIAEEIEA